MLERKKKTKKLKIWVAENILHIMIANFQAKELNN